MLVEAGVRLRRLREAAELTQEDLAERAGVTARTVRNLESGATAAPRRPTLVRLAAVLTGSVSEREDFLRAWGLPPPQSDGTITSLMNDEVSVDPAVQAAAARGTQVTVSERCVVGADRRRVAYEVTDVFEALTDGIDSLTFVVGPNDALDLSRVRVDAVRNCTLASRRVTGSPPLLYLTFALGRRLERGETHLWTHRLDFSAAGATEPCTEHLRGFRRTIGSYTAQVQFHPAALPREVRYVYRASADGVDQQVRSVRVDRTHAAHVAVANPPAGVHGLSWEW